MKRFVTLSQECDTIFCLVDLHALTSVEKREDLKNFTRSLAASYLAIGLDPERTILFRQSDVPQVCELTWYLACNFPLGLLERAHALKDAKAKNLTPNAGLMYYPILMAADILLYQATEVPVGADQKQHIEMSREIAQRCNHRFGDLFAVPEPLIEEATGVIPGLDGRKMSKSYDNYIGLFESAKALRKKVMRIVTDSKTVEEVKNPDSCHVFQLYRHFATDEEESALSARYRAGGMGYGEAKEALYQAIEREIAPLRARYEDYISRPKMLDEVLISGAERAAVIARQTISDTRTALGINSLS
jgi:tryptophanyl-tRNA synthetase